MKTTKHCWKKLEKTQINGNTNQGHGLEDNIVKTSVLPKVTHRLNIIPMKIQMTFFGRKRKTVPKIHTESQGPLNS